MTDPVPAGFVGARRTYASSPAHKGDRRSAVALAGLLLGAGTLHFVVPSSYEQIVPRALGHARGLVLVSGAAEIFTGVLVARPATRRVGAWLAAALFVAVFPANVQMALDGGAEGGGPLASPVVAWLRLPLQVPLVVWAVRVARRGAVRPA